MDEGEQLLKEYEILRAEITELRRQRYRNMNFAWAVITALTGGAAIAHTPWISFLAVPVIASIWRADIKCWESSIKIASYVRLRLEPRLEWISWETVCEEADDGIKDPDTSLETSFTKRLFSSIYFAFCFVSLAISIILLVVYPPAEMSSNYFVVFFYCGVIYIFYRVTSAMYHSWSRCDEWVKYLLKKPPTVQGKETPGETGG